MPAFSIFRRGSRSSPALQEGDGPRAAAAAVPAPAAAREAERRRYDADLVDMLEADILKAIGSVARSALEADADTTGASADLGRVTGLARELSDGARGAALEVSGLAASAEEMAASAGEIDRAMATAQTHVKDAVGSARLAGETMTDLARASAEIGAVVDTIATVAQQTHLLALNATIEAARAGAVGRGFAVVAAEVKALSVQTATATRTVRDHIEALCRAADVSVEHVDRVVGAIGGVEPVFDLVHAAVAEQNLSIAELARRSAEASAFVDQVSRRAVDAGDIVGTAAARLHRASVAAGHADELARALGRRFVAVLRHSDIGDRRRDDRYPVELDAQLAVDGRTVAGRIVDLGAGGVLLAPRDPAGGVLPPATAILAAAGLGRLPVRVVGASACGLHCAFGELDPAARSRVADRLAEVERSYRPLIEEAVSATGRVAALVETALASRLLREADLFCTDYAPVPGTDPVQYLTPATETLERLLTPIQEELLAADPRRVFCIAIDRNGYIPVHNARYAHPQRPGETAWNTAHSRNRRIFDDRAGITAGRSTRPFTVQSYARDMGGGETVLMREIDVPLRFAGRHWGGFRMASRL